MLEYLGAAAPLRTVYCAFSRLELARFILKAFPWVAEKSLPFRLLIKTRFCFVAQSIGYLLLAFVFTYK
jgi:hypothetical protein